MGDLRDKWNAQRAGSDQYKAQRPSMIKSFLWEKKKRKKKDIMAKEKKSFSKHSQALQILQCSKRNFICIIINIKSIKTAYIIINVYKN